MFKKYLATVFLFVLVGHNLLSQIVTNELPYGFNPKNSKSNIAAMQLSVKPQLLKAASEKPIPMQFAYLIETDISPAKVGEWSQIDGGKLWRLAIESKGAYSLNFTLEPFLLPLGAKLFFYSADSTFIVGAITSANNKDFKKLAVQAIPGDKVIVEYFLPDNVSFQNDFKITRVGHDFKNAFGKQGADVCEVNINCPEGDDWQIEKHAVARILINNSFYCTGTLLNNTRQDGTPYFLTAAHCINQYSEAQNSVFYFNYESTDCEGVNKKPMQSISGSALVATGKNEKLDFTLVKLSDVPPENYNPYMAGWNISSNPPANVTTIHHPDGDIKKISKDFEQTEVGDFGYGYDSFSHWQILHWDLGTTEGGSSGSPLFDNNHYVVGDLTGGEATCDYPYNDFYSRIDKAWNDYPEDLYQLKKWLDPINEGTTKLEGLDPYTSKYTYDLEASSIDSLSEISCFDSISPFFKVKNKGVEIVTSFRYDLFIDTVLYQSNIINTNIASGSFYTLQSVIPNLDYGSHKIVLAVGQPNGEQDENMGNDTLKQNFTLVDGVPFLLDLKTDEFGYETSWTISNENGLSVYSNNTLNDLTVYKQRLCLSNGCYVFKIEDEGGDGICCDYGDGYFNLTNGETNDIIATGSDFGAEQIANFCVYPDDLIKNQGFPYRLYPNPSDGSHIDIEAYSPDLYTIFIYTLQGKLVYSKDLNFGPQTLNLAFLKNGLYIIHLIAGDKQVVTKLIILK